MRRTPRRRESASARGRTRRRSRRGAARRCRRRSACARRRARAAPRRLPTSLAAALAATATGGRLSQRRPHSAGDSGDGGAADAIPLAFGARGDDERERAERRRARRTEGRRVAVDDRDGRVAQRLSHVGLGDGRERAFDPPLARSYAKKSARRNAERAAEHGERIARVEVGRRRHEHRTRRARQIDRHRQRVVARLGVVGRRHDGAQDRGPRLRRA